MTSAEIRQTFLNFFASKGHTIVPGAPVVIKNDPTLLFTNAGMNQFKDYFLGNKKAPFNRAADTQKCLRVSGKHNDLEEVGVDTYHHTLFEMLGNWSFGDYFKAEAIEWSWELLTKVYKLDEDRLYVTIFEGDEKEGLPKDDEAFDEWKKWIPEERILLGNKKDNFWEMGDTGPCGPCTEIHFDSRGDNERSAKAGATLVNNDDPQVIEIWNNVFMQYNRLKDGSLQPLPAQHVDTGMGFERLVRVIQDKSSNYDTDVFTPIIKEIEVISKTYYKQEPKSINDNKSNIAMRVIADHIRAVSFCIADGQLPSNNGAGYVVRRILRRAVRYGYSNLNLKDPFFHKLVSLLSDQFSEVFPELEKQKDFVSKVILEEETSFYRTLASGIRRFENYVVPVNIQGYTADLSDSEDVKRSYVTTQSAYRKQRSEKKVAGDFAFELYDTYGFPLDLTILMAKELDWTVDQSAFETAMQQQKNRSRAAGVIDTEDWIVLRENGTNEFVGYNSTEAGALVTKYRKASIKGKEVYQVVLDITPFYAESGGQTGDTGELIFEKESVQVIDTKKENDLVIHFTEVLPAEITGTVLAKVDDTKRLASTVHHSATHLLHAALRLVLGNHVAQKGSLVNEEHLRFDFSHFSKMTDEETKQVEHLVNEKIRENIPVVIKELPKEEALQLGAMALFGEKYGDIVRVVIMDKNYSVELCGGTHVARTGDIGYFKIKQEAAVAAGVRRIEAVSGRAAMVYVDDLLNQLEDAKSQLKNPKDLVKAITNLQSENSSLQKHIDHLEARQLVIIRNELLQKDEIINQVNFVADIVEVSNADALKKLCFDLKNHLVDFVVVLCANIGGKPFVAISIADTVVAARDLDAGKIIKQQISPLIKGGGGGQKNLATAGGQDASNLQQVIDSVRSLL
ncbi:MAG: alanine--tRNA ligase [Bacteroidota bacterium]